jgi:N-acetylglutamate synthase-like GNAT family acetyltransferase
MPIIIRSATAADQYAIKQIVRAAQLNPISLGWPRFLLATWEQDIIGIGQVKPHGDGSRELASIAVLPEWQGQGVGSMLIRTLLSREDGALYLMAAPKTAGYYTRFGFRTLPRSEMPAYFRRLYGAARIVRALTLGLTELPTVMRRDP